MDPASPTYEYTVAYISGDEGCRRALRFLKDVTNVFSGLNITDPAQVMAMTERVLKGKALHAYGAAARNQHVNLWDQALVAARETSANNGEDAAA